MKNLCAIYFEASELGFARGSDPSVTEARAVSYELGSWAAGRGGLKAKGINNSSFVDIGGEKWPQQSQLMRPNILICVTRNKIFCFRDTADILIVKYFYIIKIGA